MDCPLNKEVICTNWVCTKHGCQRLRGDAMIAHVRLTIDCEEGEGL